MAVTSPVTQLAAAAGGAPACTVSSNNRRISGSEAHLLQLLPDLRARGWDVRFLMLHEGEPGAWEFAEELRARDVPLDDIKLRADVDPIAFGEVAAHLARLRPRILHTHLVHADVYGQLAGSVARVPLRLSTKHGFNEFREGRWFGFADRSVGSLAHVHIAISQGLARYLAETEGFEEEDFEVVHYGISAQDSVVPYAGGDPRLLCIGRLIPIKGHLVLLRALAQARATVPGVTLDLAGRGPLEPALKAYAREVMQRVERDLGPLQWLAVNHSNTENPHTHVLIRGKAHDGSDLVISRQYISNGIRGRAVEVATEWLS